MPYLGELVFFKDRSIYIVTGNGPEQYSINKTPSIVGTLYFRSIAILKNLIIFLGNDGVYSFNGRETSLISLKIKPIVDKLQQLLVDIGRWTQTSKADFDTGTLTDTEDINTNYPDAVALEYNISAGSNNFPNNDFESVSFWNFYGLANYMSLWAHNVTVPKSGADCVITPAFPFGGFIPSRFRPPGAALFQRISMYDEDGYELFSQDVTPSVINTWEQKTIPMSAYKYMKVKIGCAGGARVTATGEESGSNFESGYFYSDGQDIKIWVKKEDILNNSYYLWWDLFEGGYARFKASGTWESADKNLGAVSAWTTFVAGYLKNSQTLTIKIKSAATQGGLAGATYHTIDNGQVPAELTGAAVWIKVKAEFATSDDQATPALDSFTVQYYSSGSISTQAYALSYDNRYYLSCAKEGSTSNDLMLVLDRNLAWTKFTVWAVSDMMVSKMSFLGGDSSSSVIWQLLASPYDNINDIAAYFITKSLMFKLPDNLKRLKWLWVSADQVDNYTLNVGYAFDDDNFTTYPKVITKDGLYNKRCSVVAGQQGKLLKLKFSCDAGTGNGTLMQFKGVEIFYHTLPLRNL
jgi:hypothetical protein